MLLPSLCWDVLLLLLVHAQCGMTALASAASQQSSASQDSSGVLEGGRHTPEDSTTAAAGQDSPAGPGFRWVGEADAAAISGWWLCVLTWDCMWISGIALVNLGCSAGCLHPVRNEKKRDMGGGGGGVQLTQQC